MSLKSKKIVSLLLAVITSVCLISCGNEKPSAETEPESQNQQEENAVSFIDTLGNELTFAECPQNVVSLMGSFADVWLNAGGTLKGVTDDVVNYRELDIGENVTAVGTNREPNLEIILSLKPDFVILSADITTHKSIAETLKENNIPCAFFKVEVFEDYLNMLNIFTDITGRKDLYKENGLDVQERINKIKEGIPHTEEKPTVLLIRAYSKGAKAKTDDVMAGAMLQEFGTENIALKYPSLLEEISLEAVIKEDPDYIFVITMGADTQKALDRLKASIQENDAWANLSAVKNDRYIVLPKELFHYKPNASWDKAYEYLAGILYEK